MIFKMKYIESNGEIFVSKKSVLEYIASIREKLDNCSHYGEPIFSVDEGIEYIDIVKEQFLNLIKP